MGHSSIIITAAPKTTLKRHENNAHERERHWLAADMVLSLETHHVRRTVPSIGDIFKIYFDMWWDPIVQVKEHVNSKQV